MRLIATTMVVLLVVLSSIAAGSSIIAYTSFEEPVVYSGLYTDTLSASSNHDLIDNAGQPLVNFSPAAGQLEMGFHSYYENTRSSLGLTDGDNVGVTTYTAYFPSGVGYTDGVKGYEFSDPDGRMTLILDAVDLSKMKDAEVSVDYFVNGELWETASGTIPADEIRIWVEIDGGSSAGGSDIYLLNTDGADIDSLNIEEKWTTLSTSLPLCSTAQLKISLDSDAASEALFVDNAKFSATEVPEPTTLGLIVSALVLLAGVKIRRR